MGGRLRGTLVFGFSDWFCDSLRAFWRVFCPPKFFLTLCDKFGMYIWGMEQILIRNFGPIVNNGATSISLSKVLLLCGEQGTGKSTIAKLISQFSWLEKALVRKDYSVSDVEQSGFFVKLSSFHNIVSYFKPNTSIKFSGTKFDFLYENHVLKVVEKTVGEYIRPQIMYIPAERNLAAALEDAPIIQNLPKPIAVFLEEYYNALKNIKAPFKLPLNGYKVNYDDKSSTVWFGDDDFKIKLSEAASGFQSLVPLELVSANLLLRVKLHTDSSSSRSEASLAESLRFEKTIRDILNDETLDEKVRVFMIKELNKSIRNNRLLNVVEEPEQNLHPTSQRVVLNELLRINNSIAQNQLVMTTHSPYIINYLTLAIKAGILVSKFGTDKAALLDDVVPLKSSVLPEDVSIYQISTDGEIEILDKYDGIPADSNLLNDALGKTNDLFDKLLEIEDSLA